MNQCCRICGREDMAIFRFQDRDCLGRPRCPRCRVKHREELEAERARIYHRNAERKHRAKQVATRIAWREKFSERLAAKLAAGKGGRP